MVVPTGNILNEFTLIEADFSRSLNPNYLLTFDPQLTELVVTPCEHLPISRQQSSEHRATHHFNDRQVEVNHVRQARNLVNLVAIFCQNLVFLDICVTLSRHQCDPARNYK